MLPPHWLWCLFASALPGSIWKSEMLEACLEKPVFRVFVEQDYQQDRVDIENISRLISSIREWQIGSTEMVLDSHRFIYWDEMPSLEAISNKCVCSAVDRGSWCQHFFVLVSPHRWLDADLSRVLLLPVLWEQRVGDDRLAVPLLRGQHRRLECPGCHHRGALPHRQKVLSTFLLLLSTLYLVPNGKSCPRDTWVGNVCIFIYFTFSSPSGLCNPGLEEMFSSIILHLW